MGYLDPVDTCEDKLSIGEHFSRLLVPESSVSFTQVCFISRGRNTHLYLSLLYNVICNLILPAGSLGASDVSLQLFFSFVLFSGLKNEYRLLLEGY